MGRTKRRTAKSGPRRRHLDTHILLSVAGLDSMECQPSIRNHVYHRRSQAAVSFAAAGEFLHKSQELGRLEAGMHWLCGALHQGQIVMAGLGNDCGRLSQTLQDILAADNRTTPTDALIIASMIEDDGAVELVSSDKFVSSIPLSEYVRSRGKALTTA